MTQVAQGGTYTWTATIRDGNGALADCPDLTLTIADPNGDELAGFPVDDPDVVRDSLGEYHYDWEVGLGAMLGLYDADWAGTVDGLAVGGSDSVEVVLAGSISPFLAYATVTDFTNQQSKAETDARALTRIETALVATTEQMVRELDLDFFRHPSDGTETWYVKGNGGDLLHCHDGVVTVTQIRIRLSRWTDWITLDATDYDLEAWAAENPSQETADTEPFDHIRLNGTGDYSIWPTGFRLIEITGARGWPTVPRMAVEANLDWAQQTIAADRTWAGGVVSPDESGRPILPSRLPDSVYRLQRWNLDRYSCAT